MANASLAGLMPQRTRTRESFPLATSEHAIDSAKSGCVKGKCTPLVPIRQIQAAADKYHSFAAAELKNSAKISSAKLETRGELTVSADPDLAASGAPHGRERDRHTLPSTSLRSSPVDARVATGLGLFFEIHALH